MNVQDNASGQSVIAIVVCASLIVMTTACGFEAPSVAREATAAPLVVAEPAGWPVGLPALQVSDRGRQGDGDFQVYEYH